MALALAVSAAELAPTIGERELLRLLGLPRGRSLEGEMLEHAQSAQAWYVSNGRPFVASSRSALRAVGPSGVALDGGTELGSTVLADRLRAAEAHALVALACSAGPEVADEVKRLWAEDRPDEAFFLDRFAVAVTERLVFWASAALCRASEREQETLLPHLSPGCGHWDLADQHRVMALLTGEAVPPGVHARLGPLELLPSGALHPQHSVLAVLGVTRRAFAATPEDLCGACDLDPCAYRRAPFAGLTLSEKR
jgi:hypothetical protein